MTREEQIPERTFVPDGLDTAQRRGRACASCGKRWPRPRRPVGRLLNGTPIRVCDDCTVQAEAVEPSEGSAAPSRLR
ncbi:hypothetical protein ABGB12_04330 [Actinocorallia sp. B10E7]|uniref:hypothetical protein n=1 Tax=Actinocorallia sp. B10E7 TaxID=3153558 RepID=UPI00325C3B1D